MAGETTITIIGYVDRASPLLACGYETSVVRLIVVRASGGPGQSVGPAA